MTLKRETIAIVGAIVGANLIGILTYTQTAKSSGLCDDFSQMWQGARQAEPAKGEPIGGYHDVRTKSERPYYRDGEAPSTPHVRQDGAWTQPSAYADPNQNPRPVATSLPTAAAPISDSAQPLSRNETYPAVVAVDTPVSDLPPNVDEMDRGNLERARERARGTFKPDSQGNVGL